MKVEHRILVTTSAEKIFRIYEDVENWNTWDPDTKSAHIDGPFATGTMGRLTPTKGSTVPMRLTSVKKNEHFTVESKIPLFRMVFEHELIERNGSTEVVHRVMFSGLLSPLLGRLVGATVQKGLPVTLARLKVAAEGAGP